MAIYKKRIVKKMCSIYMESSIKFYSGSISSKKSNGTIIIHNMDSCKSNGGARI